MSRDSNKFAVLLAVAFALSLAPAQASAGVFEDAISQVQVGGNTYTLEALEKTNLLDDIYHYKAVVAVGPGQYDKITIHRVVKEKNNGRPIRAENAVMVLHGNNADFESEFLLSTTSVNVPENHSLAVYLAQNKIDVWGVDRRSTLVPSNETDFSFMMGWNTEMHITDAEVAVKVARGVRALTGSGSGKIFMLGHSRGAGFVYAYANKQASLPDELQDLKGIIPVDMVYKFAPENDDLRQLACQRYAALNAAYDNGTYYSDEAAKIKYLAYLAVTAPDAPSPFVPGFTNKQAALLSTTATYATYQPPMSSPVPYYHYLAGTFNQYGIPTGLQFTNENYAYEFAFAVPSFRSLGEDIDAQAIACDELNGSYDDNLAQIDLPVLYVGAAGGFGHYGTHTLSLLGSADKTAMVVQLYSAQAAALDYGHIDLLFAGNADTLVWAPIYNWVIAHN